MARFMEIKSINPKLKQSEIAKELAVSRSTLQRYRQERNMFPPYRMPSTINRRKQKTSNREHELKKPQMTSNDPELNLRKTN